MKHLSGILLALLVTVFCKPSVATEFEPASSNIEACLATDPSRYFAMSMTVVFNTSVMSKEDVLDVIYKVSDLSDSGLNSKYDFSTSGLVVTLKPKSAIPVTTSQQRIAFKNYLRRSAMELQSMKGATFFECAYLQSPAVTGNN